MVVTYTKAINFETFRSAQLVDDQDQPLTQPALKITFEPCGDQDPCTRLLPSAPDGVRCLLEIVSGTAGLQFPEGTALRFSYSEPDWAAGKWKLVKGSL